MGVDNNRSPAKDDRERKLGPCEHYRFNLSLPMSLMTWSRIRLSVQRALTWSWYHLVPRRVMNGLIDYFPPNDLSFDVKLTSSDGSMGRIRHNDGAFMVGQFDDCWWVLSLTSRVHNPPMLVFVRTSINYALLALPRATFFCAAANICKLVCSTRRVVPNSLPCQMTIDNSDHEGVLYPEFVYSPIANLGSPTAARSSDRISACPRPHEAAHRFPHNFNSSFNHHPHKSIEAWWRVGQIGGEHFQLSWEGWTWEP